MTEVRPVAYNKYFDCELPIVYANSNLVVYEDLLKPFAKTLKKRIKDNHQNTVLIEGRTGSGKSTLAIELCYLLDAKWDLAENYIYSSGDLKKKLKNQDSSSPISLLDEGSVSLNSNNSQRTDDKRLTVLMDTCRSLGWTTIICIPNRNDLNKRIRENHIDFLIKCPNETVVPGYSKRGFCRLYAHVYRDWCGDYWHPIGTTIFPKMDKKTQTLYEEIKKKHQLDLISKFVADDEE